MASQPELFDFLNSSPKPIPPTIEEEVLAGLTTEQRNSFLKEQKQIMQQLESKPPAPLAATRSSGSSSNGRNAAALAFERRSTAASIQTVGTEESILAAVKAAEVNEDAKIAAKLQEIEDQAARRANERRRAREAHQRKMQGGDSWFDLFTVAAPTSEKNVTRRTVPTRAPPTTRSNPGGARVAQSQGIFACLGTSVSNAVTGTSASGGDHSYSLLS